MKKKKIAIIFGGKSAEHEVSINSSKNVFLALDRKKHQPVLIGIAKNGKWFLIKEKDFLNHAENPKKSKIEDLGAEVVLLPVGKGKLFNLKTNRVAKKIDIVFPVLHGTFGEDGTVQGLLKIAEVPFVGPGVLGAAIGMDKVVMKRLLKEAGIPVANFLEFHRGQKISFSKIRKELGLPVFIKPVNLGSSVGVSKAKNEIEFKRAVNLAFEFDNRIIIEEFIKGREIECSLLGNIEITASVPGEVIPKHEFYSYEAKYLDENGAELKIPAKLGKSMVRKIRDIAIKSFKAVCCDGMGRFDFFLTKEGKIYANEINTIPGFTRFSMYPKLFEASGLNYTNLLDKLIQLGIERFNLENRLKTSRL